MKPPATSRQIQTQLRLAIIILRAVEMPAAVTASFAVVPVKEPIHLRQYNGRLTNAPLWEEAVTYKKSTDQPGVLQAGAVA